jgi:hypothetical protein
VPVVIGVLLGLVLLVGLLVLRRTCKPAGWDATSIRVHNYSTCILMGAWRTGLGGASGTPVPSRLCVSSTSLSTPGVVTRPQALHPAR